MNGYEEFSYYCHLLAQKGLAPGASGNASIKKDTHIAIMPSGIAFSDVEPKNLVEMDFAGNVIGSGNPSKEKIIHTEIYKNRNDVKAIIHTHSPFLSTFALAGKPIENSKLVELKYFFNDKVPLVSYNPPGSIELALETAEVLKNYDAAILQNHGAIVVAQNIKEALYKYEVLEYMAQVIFQEKIFSKE